METDEYTIEEKMIDVGDGHQLYSQLWGNPGAAQTIIFLHGGPGSGCGQGHKQLFHPKTQRVIFFDQRGAGKSLPYGSLEANDTDHLVDDITRVAEAYGADTFVLTGGSWGSCLALVYGIRHPEKVERMVLRGLFTARRSEIDFMDTGNIRAFFPDVWDAFVSSVPADFRSNPRDFHMKQLFGEDKQAALRSAMAYEALERAVLSLDDRTKPLDEQTFDPAPITIECHYLVNGCFIPENYVFDNAGKLTMPIALVQGRYDTVCPPVTAYELHNALPDSKLFWTVAGHSGSDRANLDVVKALLSQ